jgi:hypothetical protein
MEAIFQYIPSVDKEEKVEKSSHTASMHALRYNTPPAARWWALRFVR